ncbi:hypothetical protein OIDMADRAFT_106891 [Oidiodendron maius Zn]|uniref:Zn(2)-C6 fungal-type domain-containing protein n=1 Tax=Oidiodendron maius (strain Zn) TaxID=913774 RepID=A0A0C3CVQ0_OIDMZ|nr:hypothetical protein OIDMADRAFT_106891 [Oidiodendron maius Zn]
MPPERTPKRTRQACELCRRKKSKCPGEKPECSGCTRLGHECVYTCEYPYTFETECEPAGGKQSSSVCFPVVSSSLPPWESIDAAGALYLLHCDCQPLPLFYRDNFLISLRSREPEVLFSILALTARFSDLEYASAVKCTNVYMEQARRLVTRNIFEGNVRLSTLQSLCLLNIIDFTSGNTHRASLSNCLAMDLARSAGLPSENYTTTHDNELTKEERRRCFWSIVLCKRLHGAKFSSLDLSVESDFPCYPKSTEQPLLPSSCNLETDAIFIDESHSPKDAGIIAYMLQLTEVWFKTTQYAQRHGKPSQIPPWSSQSEYSTIASQQMEFETKFPCKHRFKLGKFNERTSQELNSNRSYWGPWLFIQFLYHTNICLLNHPLLLSLRLRNFRSCIPEMFLQQTSDLISSHATWVVRFIDMLESKAYKASDPFLGHCTAIIATIHLQRAYTDANLSKREEKKIEFTKCLNFIHLMGEQWPHMAEKLQHLETVVSTTNSACNQSPQVPTRGMLINLGCFWEILEYCAASAKPPAAQNLISPELYTSLDSLNDEVSLTTPLPDTFRLDDYNNREPNSSNSVSTPSGELAAAAIAVPEMRNQNQTRISNIFPEAAVGADWVMGLNNFSEDELAVLADNFFDVGNPNPNGNEATGWWTLGNL